MRRPTLRRLGVMALALLTATWALAAPVQAEPATGTITGQLLDAGGAPVAGAFVAVDPGYDYTTTDENGNFELAELEPGDYRVLFEPEGGPRQYAYQQTDWYSADIIAVAAGESVIVNETLLPTGSLGGRFTDTEGNGLADVDVSVEQNQPGSGYGYATTDSDGRWQVDGLLAGEYRVGFLNYSAGIDQYAYGKTDSGNADIVVVVAGEITTVDDSRLPTGTVRITATDAGSGEPVQSFWATVGSFYGETDTGELLVEVPAGEHPVEVSAYDYLSEHAGKVTAVAGDVTDLAVTLTQPAEIKATIVDASTGAPVPGVCVMALPIQKFTLSDCWDPSNDNGEITLSYLRPGTYQLFAFPSWAPGYGAQWVGRNGGTGNQLLAKPFRLEAGETVTDLVIEMDRAGTVTGQVRTVEGSPASGGVVSIFTEYGISGDEIGGVYLDEEGRYTIDFLGPYLWPLRFAIPDHAAQWSGGAATRWLAPPVALNADQTTVYDYQMRAGSTVSATVSGLNTESYLVAYDAITGDIADLHWVNPFDTDPVVLRIKGPLLVKFHALGEGWYGGDSFANAKLVYVPASGNKDVNLDF